MGSRRWSNVTKIVVVATLTILAIILMVTFRAMITPTVVAFLLAFVLGYPVNWIQRSTGWPRGISITLIYIVFLSALVVTSVLLLPRSVELLQSLRVTLEDVIMDLQNVTDAPLLALGPLQLSLNNLIQQAGDTLSNVLVVATGNPLSIARGLTTGILTVVYVLVLNFWILKDLHKLQRLVLENIPADYQEDARRLGSEIGQIWQSFLRGQLTLAFVVGFLTWIPLLIVGMPNSGGLALLAGVMEFLPSIGPGISGAIGTTIALFRGSLWMPLDSNIIFALIVLGIYAVIAQIESIYLIPRLVGGRVRLHPAVTFVGVISGAIVFGLLGVLLATPMIASTRTVLSYIYRKLFDLEPFEPLVSSQSAIRIPGVIAGRKIDAVIFDLDGTLAKIDWRAVDYAATHFHFLDRLITPDDRKQITRRLMVRLEGFINFLDSQSQRLDLKEDLTKRIPVLDHLRGYPPGEQLTPIPGIQEMLRHLMYHYQLIIVSTRHCTEIDCFLEKIDIPADDFALVLGREDVRNVLPHSEALLTAAEQLNLEPDQLLVVSDTDVNLRSAKAVRMTTVGVLSGLSGENDIDDADLVLPTTSELVEWL